ncbi:hypothetical protein TNCV_458631 [Trichonephila clavipes]|nr:hypothetical protein TNCV_458631 [Trichonephila clavipes]
MLDKVIENWTSRLDYIRASRGSHMPEIIFKIMTKRKFSLQEVLDLLQNLPSEISEVLTEDSSDDEVTENNVLKFLADALKNQETEQDSRFQ